MRTLVANRAVGLAWLGFMSCAALLAGSLATAFRPVSLRPRPAAPEVQLPLKAARADTSSDDLIDAGADHDPFSPSRTRPPRRYGEPLERVAAQSPAPAPEVIRLVGTVVQPGGGSFVLCQLGAGAARVVRVGQTLGAYQLRSITQGFAIFVAADGQRLELRVPRAGS